jgi:hypothetical protein
MKKNILWSVASVLIIGIVVAAIWWLRRPPIITLSDGTKLTLLGVEYGKHHKFPTVKTAGHRNGGPTSFDTTNDTLVVWVLSEHKGNQQWGNFQVMAYDKAATAGVGNWLRNSRQIKNGMEIMGVQLDAFPRRDRKIYLHIMNWGQRGQQIAKGQFVISNPVRGKIFEKWTADPLPNTQSDGDLDVMLTKLIGGAQSPYDRGNGIPKNDPINKIVQIGFDLQQKGQSTTNWRPVQVETTDATGNYVKGWINQNYQNGQATGYFYQPGLWPDEPAWKVRVEFSRSAGFAADELWSVTNIPVRAGSQQEIQNLWNDQMNSGRNNSGGKNIPFAETTLNGVHVKLFPAIQYTDQNQFPGGDNKMVSITIKTDPDPESNGMRMTPWSITDNQGRALYTRGSSWGSGNYQYNFSEPRNIQSLNITIALHKSRFVEFTVKPEKSSDTNSP